MLLTFDRTSLPGSLAPLVVGTDPADGIWIQDAREPGFEGRYLYAPDDPTAPGSALLAFVLEMASLPATIYVQAASGPALQVLKNELAAAASQFAYDLTLEQDGVEMTFAADPTWPQWFADEGMQAVHMARTTLTIRVNPPGA